MAYYYVPSPGATVAATDGGYPVGYTPLTTDISMYSPRPYVNYVNYRPYANIGPNPFVDANQLIGLMREAANRNYSYTPMAPTRARTTGTTTGSRQAPPTADKPDKPAEPAPKVTSEQPAPEFKPNPANAGGGGGGGGVGPEPVASPMPNLFRGYVNPNYPDVAPKAPRLQELLTMPFSEWPDAISRWWNNRDTPSSAFAGDATTSPATSSSYWGTMGAQNTARRALGLDEVAGPSRPANPAAPRSTVPAELTTPPDLMAKLQAQGTVVPQDKLPPVVTPTVTELAAPAPYKPRDVLPPEVQMRAVPAPTRAPVGQSNGSIPAPVYRSSSPANALPTVLAAPAPVDVLGPVPEWYRSPAVRQYDRPNVSDDDPGSDLPFGIGAAADLYYNRLKPGYRENVVPVMDAAGDTLAAAARVGQDIVTQAYNNMNKGPNVSDDDPGSDLPFGIGAAADLYYNRLKPGYRENVVPVMDAAGDTLAAAARVGQDIVTQAYNIMDKRLNEYWAQFYANQFAKRGPLEGQNLKDYLTQAQILGFYDEALQYLGR